jgi:multidrug resistance efflux pump
MDMEKPGSTRIIMILPEGTQVKKGDVVCELDSAAFKDELQAQLIRWFKAQSAVEQVQAVLQVNEITLKEYRDGILPQDNELVRQYLATCRIDADRARRNFEWSRQTAAKGFRSPSQVQADALAYQQAQIALQEAEGMAYRLKNYTGPKLLKNLEAKNAAIKADKLAQESAFELESIRKKRLEAMIAKCTLRAPRDGIVAYANQSNNWGQVQNPIQEGSTVREGQAIINLPDPHHMRVRAKVNESKVSSIHRGQRAAIVLDAFPERPLKGTVAEVTVIPAPANGPMSDVRVYYATVDIDTGGFAELRPGLSAEVTFLVEAPRKVTRVPLQAVRWLESTPYVAVARPGPDGSKPRYEWRTLSLGQSDPLYAEVVSGLKPGDRVFSRPDQLPAPHGAPAEAPGQAVARAGE